MQEVSVGFCNSQVLGVGVFGDRDMDLEHVVGGCWVQEHNLMHVYKGILWLFGGEWMWAKVEARGVAVTQVSEGSG